MVFCRVHPGRSQRALGGMFADLPCNERIHFGANAHTCGIIVNPIHLRTFVNVAFPPRKGSRRQPGSFDALIGPVRASRGNGQWAIGPRRRLAGLTRAVEFDQRRDRGRRQDQMRWIAPRLADLVRSGSASGWEAGPESAVSGTWVGTVNSGGPAEAVPRPTRPRGPATEATRKPPKAAKARPSRGQGACRQRIQSRGTASSDDSPGPDGERSGRGSQTRSGHNVTYRRSSYAVQNGPRSGPAAPGPCDAHHRSA